MKSLASITLTILKWIVGINLVFLACAYPVLWFVYVALWAIREIRRLRKTYPKAGEPYYEYSHETNRGRGPKICVEPSEPNCDVNKCCRPSRPNCDVNKCCRPSRPDCDIKNFWALCKDPAGNPHQGSEGRT